MRKYAVVLAFVLVASGGGGSSDSVELQALREEVEALEAQTTTAAPATSVEKVEEWPAATQSEYLDRCWGGFGREPSGWISEDAQTALLDLAMAMWRTGEGTTGAGATLEGTFDAVCQCTLAEMESNYTLGDLWTLTSEERFEAETRAGTHCVEALGT